MYIYSGKCWSNLSLVLMQAVRRVHPYKCGTELNHVNVPGLPAVMMMTMIFREIEAIHSCLLFR